MPVTLEEHIRLLGSVLKAIAENEGVSISDLSRMIGKNRPQVYTIVKTLESLGLITKKKVQGLPPKVQIYLSSKGRILYECLREIFMENQGQNK
ncbi:helix-turn-helix domain-containing protein [Desulfurococcaceae archaeon MEX13E-LK6-19]|nr:helix-turn-helix domain-containing protein [Desulfurococcaceae archaeon MEX13E-LK6-19]